MKCSRFAELLVAGRRLDREGIEHVLACDACREVWITAKLVEEAGAGSGEGPLIDPPEFLERRVVALGERTARPRRRLLWAGALSAAAGLVLVVLGLTLVIRQPAPDSGTEIRLRGAVEEGPRLVAPRGEIDAGSGVTFRWTATERGGAPPYRLVVMDLQSGASVIEAETSEPVYTPGDAELQRLQPGVDYTWIVEPVGPGDGVPSEAVVFRRVR